MIAYIKGNILAANADAVAHGVNCEGVMNAGLAKKIRELYPRMYGEYISICNSGLINPGNIHFYYPNNGRPSIINMFTQKTIAEGSKLEYIAQCLDEILENHSKWRLRKDAKWKIKTIAMPHIGTGLGRLRWKDVKSLMENKLSQTELEIKIYSL